MRRLLRLMFLLLVTLLALVSIAHLLRSSRDADRAWREKYGISFVKSSAPSWLTIFVDETTADKFLPGPVYAVFVEYADDELLNYLATFSSLESITKLKTLKKLIIVHLLSAKVTPQGKAKFQAAQPGCKITFSKIRR